MKRANGSGTIIKLAGNRRKPYACRKTVGWTEKGYPKYKYISYHATKREAERALAEYNNAPYIVNSYTFKDIFDRWIESDPNKRDVTLKNYRKSFRNFADIHDVKMRDITTGTLQRFLDTHDFTKATLYHMRVLLNMMIDYCIKRDILPYTARDIVKNLDFVPKKATNKIERRIFTKEEIKALYDHSDDMICRMILVYIYTGLRFEELHNLTEDCCHENYIEIKNAKTAAGNRIVPLSNRVLALLPIASVPCYNTFRRMFNVVCAEILHSEHTLHDTRHTFITMLAEKEIDSRVIKTIVGHKSEDITEGIYTHISLEKMLDAVNVL